MKNDRKGVFKRFVSKLIGIISLIASLIAVFSFVSNFQSVEDIFDNLSILGFIKNPLAEKDGVIWEVSLYNNIELKPPVIFEGRIQGAKNGLRTDWGLKSPNRKINVDYFSGVFTTTVDFNAGIYCFSVEADDGVKIFIDGVEIRNAWWGYTPGAVYKNSYQTSEGSHVLQIQYFDETEEASFHFFWYENPGPECITINHPGVK